MPKPKMDYTVRMIYVDMLSRHPKDPILVLTSAPHDFIGDEEPMWDAQWVGVLDHCRGLVRELCERKKG